MFKKPKANTEADAPERWYGTSAHNILSEALEEAKAMNLDVQYGRIIDLRKRRSTDLKISPNSTMISITREGFHEQSLRSSAAAAKMRAVRLSGGLNSAMKLFVQYVTFQDAAWLAKRESSMAGRSRLVEVAMLDAMKVHRDLVTFIDYVDILIDDIDRKSRTLEQALRALERETLPEKFRYSK